ncbi:hypothetical protein FALBO_14776 [Fusarium albosuccineum]|uniref:Uncharacterized protein n=1 Tax=Fusarium albosuccineum TaxID=1237068 RepID=A0A8H4KZI2_9HYPO|nr:hypothetical protein FALBO_14776 [Fusarium albosuccineum]
MPFVGEDVHPGRKRRWSDDDDQHATYSRYPSDESRDFYLLNQRPELAPRKILPLTKRARITDDDILPDTFAGSNFSVSGSHKRRRSSQLKMLQVQPAFTSRVPLRAASTLLAPCHICHRKPTKKSDLDSFADCQCCAERTCFVCIRECQGWSLDGGSALSEQEVLSRSFHMDDVDDLPQERRDNSSQGQDSKKGWDAGRHCAVVCSRCCVERGAEGEVACLGCFSRMEVS